jgi:methionyl-tRNA formyltransferase
MRIVILTSIANSTASRALPELCDNQNLDVAGVVLAHGLSRNWQGYFKRKTKKMLKIGIGGTLNGFRMRNWYNDPDSCDIRERCNTLNVPLHETPYINCNTTKTLFRKAEADLGLSLGNGYISKGVFSIPPNGMLNIHTELLPIFQGAQSIIWPIYEGISETGFTIHQVEKKIDAGEILYQERYPIEFFSTLRETVQENLKCVRSAIPKALSYTCENYFSLKSKAVQQDCCKSYTTPSIVEFFQMVKNNKRMYKESLTRC